MFVVASPSRCIDIPWQFSTAELPRSSNINLPATLSLIAKLENSLMHTINVRRGLELYVYER